MNRSLTGISAASLALLACAGVLGAPPPVAAGDKFPMLGLDDEREAASPGAVVASLAIRAVQGTPGGPAIGAAAVEVQLVHRGVVVETIETTLDEHGVAMLEDLVIEMPVQPVVIVPHGGVMYQTAGEIFDATHRLQTVEVVCYEITDAMPAWSVKMRHLMLSPSEEGLHVTEIMVIDNPARQTWVGAVPAGGADSDRRETSVFDLPAHAGHVELGRGFHDWCCTSLDGGRLVNHLPIMPGSTEMSFSYVVHEQDGAAAIDIVAPAPVDHLLVLAPADMTVDAVETLTIGGTQTMGDATLQVFSANGLTSGERSRIVLAGLGGSATSDVAAVAEATSAAGFAKLVAAIGGGLILLVALVLVFSKSSPTTQQA